MFLIVIFTVLVVLFALQYDDLGNVQFYLTGLAFVLYLLYLSGNKYIMEKFEEKSMAKYLALPSKIKDMVTLEIDQYIAVMKGSKDVYGKDPEEEYIEEDIFKKNKDSLLTRNEGSSIIIDQKAFDTVKNEYFHIDKIFRDLRLANAELYKKSVYDVGNKKI
jgi:hypothetical protein